MRLLKLSCDKESFKTVNFNSSGVSIILGKKSFQEEKGGKKTYNSVGKSLLIAIIHFCLASNRNPEFEEKIPDWNFILDFELDGAEHSVARNTSTQKIIELDGEKMSLDKFRNDLDKQLFKKNQKTKFLTFRTLISRFIRPKKSSYVSYSNFVSKEPEYAQLLNNGFLLGLDINKIESKYLLKEEYDKIEKLKANIEKDQIFKSYFAESNDVDISIADLQDKIKIFKDELIGFKVAENYDEIKKEADRYSYQRNTVKNQLSVVNDAIGNIDKSLEINPDIPFEKVQEFYDLAKINIPDLVVKRIEDVEKFHNSIISDRLRRLTEERSKLINQRDNLDAKRKAIARLLDESLQYLNEHGALEEYTSLNRKLSNLTVKLSKLTAMKDLLEQYSIELTRVKQEFINQNIETDTYLRKNKNVIDENLKLFRSFSKEFYEDKAGGISVKNNENRNKIRFDINTRIQDDSGDGVNEVKIFCFDLSLLVAGHNHNVKFILHDSRLLGDMDPRQRATLFKIANKIATEQHLQYIVSANQDMLVSVKSEFDNDELYDRIVKENIVLELTDESPESKLLGVEVDLNYEKDD